MQKNLAIYVHHDSKGEVGEYIIYCLQGLKKIINEILFVVNGDIQSQYKTQLENMGVTVLQRENVGFDWSGWKYGIEYIGYDKLKEYDNLLITNNTFYGPIYPFEEMWNEMSARSCDFWGINKHPNIKWANLEGHRVFFYEHIQSYWVVFKNKILNSKCFENYWKNISVHKKWIDMVTKGEFELTRYFLKFGFVDDCYMNFEKYSRLVNCSPTFLTDIQVIEDRCPIIKRKYLYDCVSHIYHYKVNDGARKLLDYVNKNTFYNVDLIYKDLIAKVPNSVLNRALENNFILSTKASGDNGYKSNAKVVVIAYIYPQHLVDYCYSYLKNVPSWVDIIIVNTSEIVQKQCKDIFASLKNHIEYRLQKNRGRDNSALLITCKDIFEKYDYFCFVHSKESKHWDSDIIGMDFCNHCFNDLLFNKSYIENVIETLDNNKFLGLLVPFLNVVQEAQNLINCNNLWTCNYDYAAKFLEDEYNITDFDKKPIVPIGGMFWGKTKAFKTLMSRNWHYEDFKPEPLRQSDGELTHVIERIHSILAQKDGYLTGWVAPDYYASIYLNDLCYAKNHNNIPVCYEFHQKNTFLENIFSVRNTPYKRHKVVTILGVKMKFKMKENK